MKIKKKTGVLMLTAAVAAITGVSAVSYAAWTGSNSVLTAQAATGSAYLLGFTEDQSAANMDLGTLVPYDQSDSSIENGKKVVSNALPEYAVYGKYTVTVESTTDLTFYVLVGAQQTAAPTGDPNTWTDWKKVTADGVAFEFTATPNTLTKVSTTYLSLVLVSNDTAQMNHDPVSFTVTLAEAPATPATPTTGETV